MVPGLQSQLELGVDSKPSAGSPRCGAPTAPVCGAAAQEKKKPCYVPRDHAGGSTTLGLRWSLVGGSMTDARLRHITFRHRPHTECTQQLSPGHFRPGDGARASSTNAFECPQECT